MDYKVDHFKTYDDERGRLVVFLRESELSNNYKKFGQIYFVTFNKKNIIRGNHYHKIWREWFGLIVGKIQVKLKDVNTQEEVSLVLNTDDDKYIRLEIGPNIVHAFKSISSYAALINYTNKEWTPNDTYDYKII